jgi:hypothetical protein
MSKSSTVKLVKRNNIKSKKVPEFPALYKYINDGSIYLFTKPTVSICLIENDDYSKFGKVEYGLDCTMTEFWTPLPSKYAVKIFNQ